MYPKNQQDEQYQDGIKPGLSWEQVGTKIGLSWDEVEKLFIVLQEPKTMNELKELYQWANTTKFRAKYVSPLIEDIPDIIFPHRTNSLNSFRAEV